MTTTRFLLDVNTHYRGKEAHAKGEDGSKPSGVIFNDSFETYELTPERLLKVISNGFSYNQSAFAKVPPYEYGTAVQRGVFSMKIEENFVEAQVLTLDDDRGIPNAVEEWMANEWVAANAYCIAHSASSEPGVKEKVHIVFIFDTPVTDAGQWKTYLKAAVTFFPQCDALSNIMRTIFNRETKTIDPETGEIVTDTSTITVLGNIVTHQEWNKEIVYPWVIETAEKRAIATAEILNQKNNLPVSTDTGSLRDHLAARLAGIERFLANKTKGDSRNHALCSASYLMGQLHISPWTNAASDMVTEQACEEIIVRASIANGYEADYGNGTLGRESRRIFRTSFHAANEPMPEPHLRKRKPLPQQDRVETDKIMASYLEGFEDGVEWAVKYLRKDTAKLFEERVSSSSSGLDILYESWDQSALAVEHYDGTNRRMKIGGNHLFIAEPLVQKVEQGVVFLDGPLWAMEEWQSWLETFQESEPQTAFFGAPPIFAKETVSLLHPDYFDAPRIVFCASDNTPDEVVSACYKICKGSARSLFLKIPSSTPPPAREMNLLLRQAYRTMPN